MNQDNRRLKEIQEYKTGYQTLQDKAQTLSDILEYQNKIDELTREEKEILQRTDVIL